MSSGRPRSVLLSLSAAVAVGSLALLALPGGAGAAPAGAPGNNGTVKIHEGAGEPAPETRNEPQVCRFHLHALFFDAGQRLGFTVTSWPPTGERTVVRSGTIVTDGSGEVRTAGEYALPDGHYRLTVDTGNGTPTQDKHKMFWVRCGASGGDSGGGDSGGGDSGGGDSGGGDSGGGDSGGGDSGGGDSGGGDSGGDEGGIYRGAPAGTPTPPAASATPVATGGQQPAVLAQTGVPGLLPITGLGLALLLAGIALAVAPVTRTHRR